MKRIFLLLVLAYFIMIGVVICYGAEALVAVRNSKWQEGHVQDGAIVDVRPDGFEWGRKEKKKFVIVKVSDELLKIRDEVRQAYENGRVKYNFEYYNYWTGLELEQIRTKTVDNIYNHVIIQDSLIKVKDEDNINIGTFTPTAR